MSRRPLAAVADSGPVVILAAIAAAGSFTHIRDTATEHGQHGWMAWAVAVCIDLTCVMAARERQRDKRTGRETARLSWPTVVLVGGILLSLAANLAQAEPTVWGWLSAATPAGGFLVAVSMLERRASGVRPSRAAAPLPAMAAPPSFGQPPVSSPASASSASPEVQDDPRPELAAAVPAVPAAPAVRTERDEAQTEIPIPDESTTSPESSPVSSSGGPAAALVDYARRVATDHQSKHGRPITRDALRARLGVSNQLASDLLRQIRPTPETA
ncbi:MAG: putative domain containing protein [Streptosporangiaceae bacterium]|nr:putative domain containing protein [Streptosporangiaceae bacterium]